MQTSPGCIAVVRLPEQCYSSELPLECGKSVVLLENVQDPGNVGTLIRTAAALDYSGVLLSSQCADPFSSKVVQSSAGAILSVWIRRSENYLQMAHKLKLNGFQIFAADIRGEEHVDFSKYDKQVIALGNEGSGLSEELLSLSIPFRIPYNSGKVESLNVGISGGIAMFSAKHTRGW